MNWTHHDTWRTKGKNFCIEITHYTVPLFETGSHRWCVYAYIYPEHPTYKTFNPDGGMWQPATDSLPLHGGCTYLRWHYGKDSKELGVQVGADYNHLNDDHYTYIGDPISARSIFVDAEKLFHHLSGEIPEELCDGLATD